jgi:hypothetical protein
MPAFFLFSCEDFPENILLPSSFVLSIRSPFAGPGEQGAGFGVWGSAFDARCGWASHDPDHQTDAEPKSIPNFVLSAPLW